MEACNSKTRQPNGLIDKFVSPGDVVFDIGAHVGSKTDIYLSRGAQVVCFEPQTQCVRVLYEKYRDNQNVRIVNKGLADKTGQMQLSICDSANVLSTFSEEWKTGRFADYSWDRVITVEVTTLDEMIGIYGHPKYCKIDVEGFEFEVLKGLSQPVPYLSFEFAIEFLENAKKCLCYLQSLGYRHFNLALEETPKFVFSEWISPETLIHHIERLGHKQLWGDIYAKANEFQRKQTSMKNYDLNKRISVTSIAETVKTKPLDIGRFSEKVKQEHLTDGELGLIEKFIAPGDVAFDIGANVGTWTKKVLNRHSNIQVHSFEPAPESYQKLLQNLAEPIGSGQVIANNCAASEKKGNRAFYYYRDKPSWSTFHRRLEVEKQYNLESPESLPVSTVTLDSYCEKMNVRHIHFLKIDTEGSEMEVLKGAEELLHKGRIDYLQFEYGGTFLDAGITLQNIFQYLQNMRYELFKLSSGWLKHIEQFSSDYEDYEYSNFLAVNERFKSKVLGQPPKMLNLRDLCSQYNIVPRGIIHIGAYEGKEIKTYKEMAAQKVLFIEANPAVYKRLVANISTLPNVDAVNCAVSNYDGTTSLHVTSMDQSSSVLPLKRHLEIYPDIKEVNQITVDCRTLDSLLKELGINTYDFNIINIDIQGAELMAFQGSTDTLKYIDAINTEVNYEELYEGCALIDQLDEFLESYGFERKATTSPYHRSWGDGFYVKTRANTRRPVITMSTLGKNGRFANQVFQYAFLKIYAKQHNLEVRTPLWIGQDLFGHKDPPILRKLPLVKETTSELAEAVVANAQETFENVDFWGYFQYNTRYYAPHKDYFRSLFRPVPEIEEQMNQAINSLHSKGKTIVGLHLRRSDYGYGYFFVTPNEWYKRWLQDLWPRLDEPVLFIASDEPEKVVGDFAEYNPVTTKDLDIDLPAVPFYPDFYILSKCDIVAISNSSFSFLACMLNESGKLFYRPRLSAETLIPFEPWDSEPILRDEKVLTDKTQIQDNRDKNQANALNQQGEALLDIGDIEGAINAFIKAIEIHSDFSVPYNNLGVLFWQQGQIENAVKHFVKALEIDPLNRNTIWNCAEVFKSLQRFEDARQIYSSYLKRNPDDKEIASALLQLQPEHKAPQEIYRQTEEHRPNVQRPSAEAATCTSKSAQAKALNQQGEYLFFKGDIEGALNAFTRAIEIHSDFALPHNNLGVLFWKKGQTENAVKHFVKSLEIDPNNRDTISNCNEAFKSLQRSKYAGPEANALSQQLKIASEHKADDRMIPPEIKNDEFYYTIQELARTKNIKTILEIGSSAGDGSTEAFVTGLRDNPNRPMLYCIEAFKPRFAVLKRRYADNPQVKCYQTSTVSIDNLPTEQEVVEFYNKTKTNLNRYPLEQVLGWLRCDKESVKNMGTNVDGVALIKKENNIKNFDMVLIDGSAFTGFAELETVYGARLILLDDINDIKNYKSYKRLLSDPNYKLVKENWNLRNGYAVFERNDNTIPINFFTIVLNGQPFIRHHIEVFNQLPFKWHWHIIEGVAELKHDTAWSVKLGGRINEQLHRNGLSNDGTTEYIDEIAKQFPDNVTIYRKVKGVFWEGKLEMVNAPLANINEQCLLWEVDSDELWTLSQIEQMRSLFLQNPYKTSAYFHCYYFVGPRKYVSSLNTWATYPNDWIRVWRFSPSMKWTAHEPPTLVNTKGQNVGLINPFTRDETKSKKIIFQHFAYVTEPQVRFKEIYYGYKDAVAHWKRLQETHGPVRPADYLPWAKSDAIVDDWKQSDGALLSERLPNSQIGPTNYSSMSVDAKVAQKGCWKETFEASGKVTKQVKVAEDYIRAGIKVDPESSFGTRIQKLFTKIHPRKIIETGTYLGTGTTTIIAKSLQRLGIDDAMFFTIEVNPQNHARAKQYFEMNNMKVNALNGLSMPRAMLPSREEIAQKTITDVDYDGIFVDHKEENRVELYYNETNFPNLPDDLLYKCLKIFDFKPDFVLLDSGGHMGNIEFKRLIDNLQGECYIALDDIYHVKHHRSFQQIQEDERFELIVHSKEKFGFCIAKFTPICGQLCTDKHLPIKEGKFETKNVKKNQIAQAQALLDQGQGATHAPPRLCMPAQDGQWQFSSSHLSSKPQPTLPSKASNSYKNILWIRPDSIGDNVLAASMLPHIRKKYKNAKITIVCQEHIAKLYEACPYTDDIIAFNKGRFLQNEQYFEEIMNSLRTLKADLSLHSVYSRELAGDLLAIMCDAKQRIALKGDTYNILAKHKNKLDQLYTRLLPSKGKHKLELDRHKDFLRGLNIDVPSLKPMIWTTVEDEEFAEKFFEESNFKPEHTIALFAGAQQQIKSYDKYGQALSEFCKENHLNVVALGAENDRNINQRNLSSIGVKTVNLSGKTTICQSAEILRRCRLAVGADTGLAHISCAVAVPNVILLGGAHFGRFMPYSPLTAIVCLPLKCYGCNWGCRYLRSHCINDVRPEVITEALRQVLAKRSEKTRVFVQGNSLWQPKPGQPAWSLFDGFLDATTLEIITVPPEPSRRSDGLAHVAHLLSEELRPDAQHLSADSTAHSSKSTVTTIPSGET